MCVCDRKIWRNFGVFIQGVIVDKTKTFTSLAYLMVHLPVDSNLVEDVSALIQSVIFVERAKILWQGLGKQLRVLVAG